MSSLGSPSPLLFGGAKDYEIEKSLRFNGADNAYLNFTPSSAGNRKAWTYSVWIKRSALTSGDYAIFGNNANYNDYLFYNATTDDFEYYVSSAGAYYGPHNTTPIYRDITNWYHVVWTRDTDNSTDADRSRLYVNGVRQAMAVQPSIPSGFEGQINNNSEHRIGNLQDSFDFEGYMTEINFIDGQALDHSSFGEINADTGAWVPKKFAGSYGTNGFYLNFSDNSGTTATTLGKDSSGNSNNWTPNNFSVTAGVGNDSVEDTPTNNWCTIDPITSNASTVREGALQAIGDTGNSNNLGTIGTFAMTSGKWYWELTSVAVGGATGVGIMPLDKTTASQMPFGGDYNYTAGAISYYTSGIKYIGNGTSSGADSSYGASWTTNDVIGVAFDADNNAIWFSKNGTWQNSATASEIAAGTTTNAASSAATGEYFPCAYGYSSATWDLNFGQKAFIHTPPTGFKTLCAANLPEPTIKKGTDHFNTVLYEGTGSKLTAPSVGFQPDLTWIKNRDAEAIHYLQDAVRGDFVGYPNSTGAWSAGTGGGWVVEIADGFTADANGPINTDDQNFVAWCWKGANGTVSNSDGSITSTVSVNQSAGISIVKWTGSGANATIGHGLGATPAFIWVKNTSDTASNLVRHHKIAVNSTPLIENPSSGITTDYWNTSSETRNETVFSVSSNNEANGSNDVMIAYCFAEVEGFSKMGIWKGNASTDGPLNWCGFRPAFLLQKRNSDSGPWVILDGKRNPYNPVNKTLYPSEDEDEYTNTGSDPQVDFLSNGFKVRSSYPSFNGTNDDLIWMAFASVPFKYANAY